MASRYSARAISMDFHDSSDDEAILFEDVHESDSEQPSAPGTAVSPHPIPSMAGAFQESILDSAEQVRTGKPPLQFSSLTAEERRERLLSGEEYNDTYNAMWKEDAASKYHPLRKIMAQIAYGVHLLHVQGAISDQEVIRILQRHIDEVDEFIRRADEDIGMALSDIEGRVNQLKFVLDTDTMFNEMLDDRKYRMEVLAGNEIIESIIKRTASLMNDLLADIKCGSESIKEMSAYMAQIGATWPSRTDMGLHDTMLANTEGWMECFEGLSIEGNILGLRLMQLSRFVNEMANRAGSASRRQALASKSSTSLSSHSPSLSLESRISSFPVRGSSSSQVTAKLSPHNHDASARAFLESHNTGSTSTITPETYEQWSQDVASKRRTNISEKRATAISDKRASTATIASLFVSPHVDDAPAVPELPKNPRTKKSRIPKIPKLPRPHRISISEKFSFTGRSRSASIRKDAHAREPSGEGKNQDVKSPEVKPPAAEKPPSKFSKQKLGEPHALEQRAPIEKAAEAVVLEENHLNERTPSRHAEEKAPQAIDSGEDLVEPDPPDQKMPEGEHTQQERPEQAIVEAPHVETEPLTQPSSDTPVITIPPVIETPAVPAYQNLISQSERLSPTIMSPTSIPSPMSWTSSQSTAPSITIKRKPVPNSAQSSAASTPRPPYSPLSSSTVENVEQAFFEPSLIEPSHQVQKPKPSSPRNSLIPPLSPISTTSRPTSASSEGSDMQVVEQPIIAHRQVSESSFAHLERPKVIEVLRPSAKQLTVPVTESPVLKSTPSSDTLSISSSTSSRAPTSQAAYPSRSESLKPRDLSKTSEEPPISEAAKRESFKHDALGIELPIVNESLRPDSPTDTESERSNSPANIPLSQSASSVASLSSGTASQDLTVYVTPDEKASTRPNTNSLGSNSLFVQSRSSSHSVTVRTEIQRPAQSPEAESQHKQIDGNAYPNLSGSEPAESPQSQFVSPPASASFNKALPPLPPALVALSGTSPPSSHQDQSPRQDSTLSTLSQTISRSHDDDSFAKSQEAEPSRPSSSRSHVPKPIDTKIASKRAMSPLAHDSAFSTSGSFPGTPRDPEFARPTTSRSMKPLSRSKLALFPSSSPSMIDLRLKSDVALYSKDKALAGVDYGGIGEEAESALPGPPPRLIPRKRDGGKAIGAGMGTRLKRLMGFGRKTPKVVGVS